DCRGRHARHDRVYTLYASPQLTHWAVQEIEYSGGSAFLFGLTPTSASFIMIRFHTLSPIYCTLDFAKYFYSWHMEYL
ncbi:Uncharacterized protein FKW44_021327, partial [Caligus rogercresseyi]